jgi:hypothetical protein
MHERAHGFGALDDGGAPGRKLARSGLVMARQVERDDPVTRFDERFHEDSQVGTAATPTVHQVNGRPLTPGLPRDSVS